MAQIKERIRKQINEAAGHYLSDQDEGDLYDAYMELKDVQDNGHDWHVADDYVNVWQPLEGQTVREIIDLIESSIVQPEVPEFLKTIDWEMLRHQKTTLIAVTEYYRNHKVPFIPEHLEGITALLDAIHDYAIDDIEITEAVEEEQAYIKLVNTPDESPEMKFARENAELIYEIAIEGEALYNDPDNPAPESFIQATVDNSFHSKIIKAKIREAIYKDVTRFPKDFKQDDQGNWTYDAEMSDYGFLIGKYCEEIYPGD